MATITEDDRLQRQQNAANYAALSQAQKKARIQEAASPEGQRAHYDGIMAKYGNQQQAQPVQQSQQIQQQPMNQQGNAQSYIDQLNNARQQAIFAQLDKSRQGALSGLQNERSAIQPKYYDQRNQVAAGSQQSARNLAEFMAARGGTRSGANAQAEISRQGVQQGNLGTLGRQEAQAYTDIERRTSDINSGYEQDRLSAVSGIEADRMQAMINQQNQDRQFGLQEAGLTGQYNGQQTLAGQSFGLQQQGQQFNQGMQNKQFDYGVQQDQRNFDYGVSRDDRQDYESDRLFEYGSYRDNVGDEKWKTEFQQSVKQQAQQMGYNYASLNQRERQMVAEQTARADDKAYSRMQDQFGQGMEAFKTTGKMPDYMENFGINTSGFNDDTTKEAVSIAYGALSDGQMTPEAMLKQVDFELKQGIIDKKTADSIKETIYYVDPSFSPESVAEQKAKQEKRQKLVKDTYDFATNIPSLNITKKAFEWGKGLFD